MSQTILHLTSEPPAVKHGEHARIGHLLSVEEARDLVSLCKRRPWQGDSTVVHLTAVQSVSADAWNVLLKVLEEPPPYVHFHLYAPSTDSLPRTIKSRSHIVRESLPRPYTEDVTRLVRYIENGDALAIIREGDRHKDVGDTIRALNGLWTWGVEHGNLELANLSEYYLHLVRRNVSPRIVVKSLLLTAAIRRKRRAEVREPE